MRRLTPERRSSGSIVSAGNRSRSSIRSIRGQYWVVLHPAAVAAACGDGWPSRPSVRPRALLRWSTRARSPSDVQPFHPCSRSLAAYFGPLTQIRDPLLPPCPPHSGAHTRPSFVPRGTSQILGLQRTYHDFSHNSQQYKYLGKGFPAVRRGRGAVGGKPCRPTGKQRCRSELGGGKLSDGIRNGSAQPARLPIAGARGPRSGRSARALRRGPDLPTGPLWPLSRRG